MIKKGITVFITLLMILSYVYVLPAKADGVLDGLQFDPSTGTITG